MGATYHHGSLRETLLDAGVELVAEAGIDALSLRELARRAGVSSAAYAATFIDSASPAGPSPKWAPSEQHPWLSSAAGRVRMPWQPLPNRQVQFDSRNARSNRHTVSGSVISMKSFPTRPDGTDLLAQGKAVTRERVRVSRVDGVCDEARRYGPGPVAVRVEATRKEVYVPPCAHGGTYTFLRVSR